MPRLLILSCSQRKRPDRNRLPAIVRYDGPLFQVIRRFLKDNPNTIDTYILSAKFGLIPSSKFIPYYDERMSPIRASELRPFVKAELEKILHQVSYPNLFLSVGKDYYEALDLSIPTLRNSNAITIASGSMGKRQTELHHWLYGSHHQDSPTRLHPSPHKKLSIRGHQFCLTKSKLLAIARDGLRTEPEKAAKYQSWYVTVDNQKVSPKWLVSKATGLPVRDFHSIEARRFLEQTGINCKNLF